MLRHFRSTFIRNIGLSFSFFVLSLSSFGIKVMAASRNEFGSVLPPKFFLNNFRRMGISSVLYLTEFTCETIQSWTLVSWEFFYYKFNVTTIDGASQVALVVKNPPANTVDIKDVEVLVAYCLTSIYFCFSHFSSCNWFIVSFHCNQEMLDIISILLN